MKTFDIAALQAQLLGQKPRKILQTALEQFDNIAISFSGAEDVVLIDLALSMRKDIRVFSFWTPDGCTRKPISLLKKSANTTRLKLNC